MRLLKQKVSSNVVFATAVAGSRLGAEADASASVVMWLLVIRHI